MTAGLLERFIGESPQHENRFYGVEIADVINNIDPLGQGRVEVRFPRLSGEITAWAPVAVLWAGPDRGTFFIPEPGDQVVIGFRNGDLRHPFVLGSLWNTLRRPPVPTPVLKRWVIRTISGHQLTFDDLMQSITIETPNDQKITLEPDKIEIVDDEEGTHRITFDENGITLMAKEGDIVLKAPEGKLRIEAKNVEIKSSAQTEIKADKNCIVQGRQVRIN